MNKLRVGVIGVGHLGSLHAKRFSELASAELVGVHDSDPARAESVARDAGCRSFGTAGELLREVEAVSIVTPTSTHFAIAQQAMEAGVHVFIEKPITSTPAQAAALAAMARSGNLRLQVGHIERFNPALLALEPYNIEPMFIESHRLAQFNPRGTDVAVVLDLMIHDIDIILSLVRSDVERIEANGVAVVSPSVDIANARLQFANGCVANVTASRISQKKMRKMRLFQRDAYISVDFSDGLAEVFRLTGEGDTSGTSTMMLGEIESGSVKRRIVYERPEIKEINALAYELELFIGAVRAGSPTAVTAEDGLRALRIAHEIIETIQQQNLRV